MRITMDGRDITDRPPLDSITAFPASTAVDSVLDRYQRAFGDHVEAEYRKLPVPPRDHRWALVHEPVDMGLNRSHDLRSNEVTYFVERPPVEFVLIEVGGV